MTTAASDGIGTATDALDLAVRLRDATAERRTIPLPSDLDPTFDVEAAYRVQAAGVELLLAAGQQVIGYKIGLVSLAKQRAMGVAEPLWGWLTDGLLLPEETSLDCTALIQPRVEPEIAFLLGRDIDGATTSVPDVLAATEGVFPALEVLDSRFKDFRFTLPDVVADNGSAARIIFGGRLIRIEDVDLQLEGMVLRSKGEVVCTAAGAAIIGHPAAAVAWLARTVGRLPAGSVILSGGLTDAIPLKPASVVTAEFATLGTVTVRCSP